MEHTMEQGLVDAVREITSGADEDLAEGNWDAVNRENLDFLIVEAQWYLTVIGAMEWSHDREVVLAFDHLVQLIDIYVYNIIYRERYGAEDRQD